MLVKLLFFKIENLFLGDATPPTAKIGGGPSEAGLRERSIAAQLPAVGRRLTTCFAAARRCGVAAGAVLAAAHTVAKRCKQMYTLLT